MAKNTYEKITFEFPFLIPSIFVLVAMVFAMVRELGKGAMGGLTVLLILGAVSSIVFVFKAVMVLSTYENKDV